MAYPPVAIKDTYPDIGADTQSIPKATTANRWSRTTFHHHSTTLDPYRGYPASQFDRLSVPVLLCQQRNRGLNSVTDFELQRLIDVIKQNLPEVATMRQVILKDELATEGNMPSEFLPTSETRR